MAKPNLPSVEYLHKRLRYEDGVLIWKPRDLSAFRNKQAHSAWNSRYADKPVGAKCERYIRFCLDGKTQLAHRVVWAICTGEWPKLMIDHINGNGWDNRIENLRDVSCSDNMKNSKKYTRNTSGHVGVTWDRNGRKWRAEITSDGTYTSLGSFDDILDAASARKAAEALLGFHANHGRHSDAAE